MVILFSAILIGCSKVKSYRSIKVFSFKGTCNIIRNKKQLDLAKELKCKHFHVSAKTGENINEALDEVARLSCQYYKDSDKRNSIRLSSCSNILKDEDKKKNCCKK